MAIMEQPVQDKASAITDSSVETQPLTKSDQQARLTSIRSIAETGNEVMKRLGLDTTISYQQAERFAGILTNTIGTIGQELMMQVSAPKDTLKEQPQYLLKDATEIVNGQEQPAGKLTPGMHTLRFKVDGKDREFDVHIPKDYDGKKELPMVLMFHGMSDGPPRGLMATETGMNKKADADDFIAVYPLAEQSRTGLKSKYSWNLLGDAPTASDNFKYVRGILDLISQAAKVDTTALAAIGFSEGGLLVNELARKMPGKFSILGSVGGTIPERDKDALPKDQSPTNVFIVNNLEDKTMLPYAGGAGTLSGALSGRYVLNLNHLPESRPDLQVAYFTGKPNSDKPVEQFADGKAEKFTYTNKENKGQVVEYRIKGQHAWHEPNEPGGMKGIGEKLRIKELDLGDLFVRQWLRSNPIIKRELAPTRN